jgi:GNAT superfamily N-acetyltransferase
MSESEAPDAVEMTVREATPEDYEDVVAFTTDTWDELDDYIPDVYHEWLDEQGDGRMTLVADAGEDIAGIAQTVILSPTEAWSQGMRVNPAYRGQGISRAITEALFDWAGNQGANVMRNMVFSWNDAGLGQSRALGFEPVTEFRWLHPEPEPAPNGDAIPDPTVAWDAWQASDASSVLDGLALDLDESWALRELTREMLERAKRETSVLAIQRDGNPVGMAYRTRTTERENEEGTTETWAEYGVGVWTDLDAAESVLAAIADDAAACGADKTRVLIPETARFVSDGAALRTPVADHPDFVLAKDLTGARS